LLFKLLHIRIQELDRFWLNQTTNSSNIQPRTATPAQFIYSANPASTAEVLQYTERKAGTRIMIWGKTEVDFISGTSISIYARKNTSSLLSIRITPD